MPEPIVNWAGNVRFTPARLHRPGSVADLAALVARSPRVRALGTGHSFNRIADTPGELVSVAGLPPARDIDTARAVVRCAAGLRYGELAPHLHRAGYALANLGSLPHISVAGACATGTHGSGVANGNLATQVAAMELVTAAGDVVTVDRSDAAFPGAVVHLGALGVVTAVTLDLVPTFEIRQYVYEGLPRAELAAHWAEVMGAGYSVSLFTDWAGPAINQVWVKQRADGAGDSGAPARWFGATLADGPRHPVPGMDPGTCTRQGGVPGPWHTRLPHFRAEFTPSSGDELQSEFFVPAPQALAALAALDPIADRIAAVLHISELRTVAADGLWLSPAYGRDSVAIHFTWHLDPAAVAPVVAAVEERLADVGARPHWGKIFSIGREALRQRYERYADFAELVAAYDPGGKFRNDLLDSYVPR